MHAFYGPRCAWVVENDFPGGPHGQLKAFPVATDETAAAADIVERFLVASMVPDPQTAALYISDDLKITFTGGRKYSHPRETAAFNGKRYKLGEEEDGTHRRCSR